MSQITPETIDDLVAPFIKWTEEITGYVLEDRDNVPVIRLISQKDYFSEVYVKELEKCTEKKYDQLRGVEKFRHRARSFLTAHLLQGQYVPSTNTVYLIRENIGTTSSEISGLIVHEVTHHAQFTRADWIKQFYYGVIRRSQKYDCSPKMTKKYMEDINHLMTLFEGEAKLFEDITYDEESSPKRPRLSQLLCGLAAYTLSPKTILRKAKQYFDGKKAVGNAFNEQGLEGIEKLYKDFYTKIASDPDYNWLELPAHKIEEDQRVPSKYHEAISFYNQKAYPNALSALENLATRMPPQLNSTELATRAIRIAVCMDDNRELAERALDLAATFNPQNLYAAYHKGRVALMHNDRDTAKREFDNLLARDKIEDIGIYYSLADRYRELNDPNSAKLAFKKASNVKERILYFIEGAYSLWNRICVN